MVAAGILLSRLAGLVRTAVIARFLGLRAVADAFEAALRISNLLQNLLGEGVLSASFIPVYSRLLAQGRREDAAKVAGAIAGLLVALTGGLAVLGVVLAGPITRVVAFGFSGDTLALAVPLTRIMFPGIGFLVLSAWCLGVLNSHRRFFLSYVAPVVWNAAQIAVLVVMALFVLDDELARAATRPRALEQLAVALAWGVLAGGIAQFAVQLPGVLRAAPSLRLSLDLRLPGVRTAVRSFWPVVAGRGVVQLMTYVDIALASVLATGALAALTYGSRLALLPISLFGMSAAASELPELASLTDEQRAQVDQRLTPTLARIAFYVVPTMMLFAVAGDLVYRSVFGLTALEAELVWLVLLGLSVGLLSNTSSRLLQSTLYADGDTRTPARYAIARVIVAAAVGALLMMQFDRLELSAAGVAVRGTLPALLPLPLAERATDPNAALRLGAVGLAVASGASSWLEFALLRRYLRRRGAVRVRVGGGALVATVTAGVAGALAGVGARVAMSGQPAWSTLLVVSAAAGTCYLGVALAVGLDEVRRLHPRRRR